MDDETLFRITFFVIFSAVLAVRGYFGWKLRRGGESSWKVEAEGVQREGIWSVLMRFGLFVYMLAAALAYALNPFWLGTLAMPLPGWARWLGAGLGAGGLALLVWVHATLGRGWSTNLQLRQEHALVTNGPYRWVRHPMYTALFAIFIGLGLVAANWLLAPLFLGAVFVLSARIGREEQMLIEQFGEQYRAYMGRTGRFLPRLS